MFGCRWLRLNLAKFWVACWLYVRLRLVTFWLSSGYVLACFGYVLVNCMGDWDAIWLHFGYALATWVKAMLWLHFGCALVAFVGVWGALFSFIWLRSGYGFILAMFWLCFGYVAVTCWAFGSRCLLLTHSLQSGYVRSRLRFAWLHFGEVVLV